MRSMTALLVLAASAAFLMGCDEDYGYSDVPYDYPYDYSYDYSTDMPTDLPDGTETGADPTGSASVGDPCYADGDCGGVPGSGRLCVNDIAGYTTFPGGYCSATCTSAMDCGTNGVCADYAGYGFYCFRRCSSDDVCRVSEGYSCKTLSTGSSLLCLPPGSGPDS